MIIRINHKLSYLLVALNNSLRYDGTLRQLFFLELVDFDFKQLNLFRLKIVLGSKV